MSFKWTIPHALGSMIDTKSFLKSQTPIQVVSLYKMVIGSSGVFSDILWISTAHIGKDHGYFKRIFHKVREHLGISFVKSLGVTGDCGVCLRIDKLRKMADR